MPPVSSPCDDADLALSAVHGPSINPGHATLPSNPPRAEIKLGSMEELPPADHVVFRLRRC